ncbi:hypothetical protein XENOCAPTIV_002417 [Xenoophorus captivus]|uniref:Glutamate decarboxylase 2 n=1 Tax=Xenoophorus captivus TaxID=1517983 RepID=A0ABV0QUR7_9TELE
MRFDDEALLLAVRAVTSLRSLSLFSKREIYFAVFKFHLNTRGASKEFCIGPRRGEPSYPAERTHFDQRLFLLCSGKLIPADLERRILEAKQKGFVPFFVSATAGTTVYGAFDPLIAISDICRKYNIWFHVDVSRTNVLLNVKMFSNLRDPFSS